MLEKKVKSKRQELRVGATTTEKAEVIRRYNSVYAPSSLLALAEEVLKGNIILTEDEQSPYNYTVSYKDSPSATRTSAPNLSLTNLLPTVSGLTYSLLACFQEAKQLLESKPSVQTDRYSLESISCLAFLKILQNLAEIHPSVPKYSKLLSQVQQDLISSPPEEVLVTHLSYMESLLNELDSE